ncbi:MAG TPA: PAS domain S-box protein, partial [Candidatus Polarisedimenticolia bacterium]|nr:PAS domain S-box protein [Candidatus Polarisedimenticolia bacterium]
MDISPDGALLAAAVALAAAAVGTALAILGIGTLRRAARRLAGQIADLRRHPQIGDLPAESDPAFRTLSLEINHLIRDLRARLREADRRSGELEAVLDGPPDLALVSTDPEWRIVSFSRGAVALTLWQREEILGNHVETLFAAGEWERILPKLARRPLREAGIVESARLLRRDGTAFPASLSVAPASPASGAAGSMLLVARDLTSATELERRLRDSEERYRRLVEGVSDGVFITQSERLVYVNPGLARLVGVDRKELQGAPFKDLLDARDLLRVVEILRRAERGEGAASGEISCLLRVRQGAPAECRVAWATTEFQGRRAVVGTIADLTERTRLERVLAASEAALRATLQSTADGILLLRGSGGDRAVSLANRAFCELFGLFAETMPGQSEAELVRALKERCTTPEKLERFFAEAGSTAGAATLAGLEIAVPRRALADLVADSVRSSPEAGEVLGIIVTARDLTARIDAETALRRSLDDLAKAKADLENAYVELAGAQKILAERNTQLETLNAELKSLDEMKSNLLANVSHELHTPLVSIKGYTEMILKRRLGPLTPEQERGLSVALKNIDRLVEMIDNLLSFSRMEKGETQLHLEDVPLWQLVDEAIEMVGERIQKKGITVTTQYETDDLVVRGDRVKLGQVLTNLLTNAVKFNRDGGRITVTARKGPRGFLEVDLADTGIGIPPEEQGKIFERFYQVDSSPSRRYEGTGIGLSIVRDILRLHGCSIRVKSEPDKGSVFTFTLPLAHDQAGSV